MHQTINCHNCKGKGIRNIQFVCQVCQGKGNYDTVTLYRYFDILGPNTVELRCDDFETIKHTPSGFWIAWSRNKPKFIPKYTEKRWAYEDKAMALESYYKRKKKQIRILKAQLERAEIAVTLTPDNDKSENSPYITLE